MLTLALLTLTLLPTAAQDPHRTRGHEVTGVGTLRQKHTGPFTQQFGEGEAGEKAMHQHLFSTMMSIYRTGARYKHEKWWRAAYDQVQGEMYTHWDQRLHRMVPVDYDPDQIFMSREMQAPNVVVYRAQLLQSFTGHVHLTPVGTSDSVRLVAQWAQRFIDGVFARMPLFFTINDAIFWQFLGGGAFHVCYDPSLGNRLRQPKIGPDGLPVRNESGEVEMAYDGAEGDLVIEVESPFNLLYGDGWRPGLGELREVYHAREYSEADFAARYGEEKLATERRVGREQPGVDFGARPTAEGADGFTANERVRVYTYWLRADATNDWQGAKVEFTEKALLRAGPNPYKHGRVPFCPFWYDQVGPYARGPGALSVEAQRAILELDRARLSEVRHGASPPLLVPAGFGVPAADLVKTTPNRALVYKGPRLPVYLAKPPYPGDIDAVTNQLLEYVGVVAHATPEARGNMRGKAPVSGRGMFALAERMQAAMGYPIGSLNYAWGDAVQQIVYLARQYMMPGRPVMLVGQDKTREMGEFDPDMLPEYPLVEVMPADWLGSSRILADEVLTRWFSLGVMRDRHGNPDARTFLRMQGASRHNEFLEPYDRAAESAQRENLRLLRGEQAPVFLHDMHDVHVSEHRTLFDLDEVRANPQIAALIEAHIREHETRDLEFTTLQLRKQQTAALVAGQLAQADAQQVAAMQQGGAGGEAGAAVPGAAQATGMQGAPQGAPNPLEMMPAGMPGENGNAW